MGFLFLLLLGCASPGPPRPPSLQLPETVGDLQAVRRGDGVDLQFAVPARTTEGLPYRGAQIGVAVCRAVGQGACLPVPALTGLVLPVPQGTGASPPVTTGASGQPESRGLRDVLPAELASGPPRLLTYRVQLSNGQRRTAGYGGAAFAAGGAAPEAVEGLRAQGSRRGVVVRWSGLPGSRGEVVLRREGLDETQSAAAALAGEGSGTAREGSGKARGVGAGAGAGKHPGRGATPVRAASGAGDGPDVQWLRTSAAEDPFAGEGSSGGAAVNRRSGPALPDGVLDASAERGASYLYAAERQQTVTLGGHSLLLHSTLSAPIEVKLLEAYPPPPARNLVGTAFRLPAGSAAGGADGELAVDLIWDPPDDAGPLYFQVYRQVPQADGSWDAAVRLTTVPVGGAAYHDVLPGSLGGAARLRYSVTAVSAEGLESAPAVAVVSLAGS